MLAGAHQLGRAMHQDLVEIAVAAFAHAVQEDDERPQGLLPFIPALGRFRKIEPVGQQGRVLGGVVILDRDHLAGFGFGLRLLFLRERGQQAERNKTEEESGHRSFWTKTSYDTRSTVNTMGTRTVILPRLAK